MGRDEIDWDAEVDQKGREGMQPGQRRRQKVGGRAEREGVPGPRPKGLHIDLARRQAALPRLMSWVEWVARAVPSVARGGSRRTRRVVSLQPVNPFMFEYVGARHVVPVWFISFFPVHRAPRENEVFVG